MTVKRTIRPKTASQVEMTEPEIETPRIIPTSLEPRDVRKKRKCLFCGSHTAPRYWDVATLKRFLSDRGRIVPKLRSGTCSRHQRKMTQEIKRARFLALLPFVPQI